MVVSTGFVSRVWGGINEGRNCSGDRLEGPCFREALGSQHRLNHFGPWFISGICYLVLTHVAA